MPSLQFTESLVEQAALGWLESLNYAILSGPQIAPGESQAERDNYGQVVLARRLREALVRLNPDAPHAALEEAFRRLTVTDTPSLVGRNHTVHRFLVEGVPVECRRPDSSFGALPIQVLDFDAPERNDFLAVNQFTVVENHHERRPDIVVFVNGLPLAVIELKNAAGEDATIWTAFAQLQTYKQQVPALFAFNEALVISDGVQARLGTITGDREWFLRWRTIDGTELAPTSVPQLRVLLEGVFDPRRFLDIIRHFVVFEDLGGGSLAKKMAGYHQYHAVNAAVDATVDAAGQRGDRRIGVVWHTQGSGKSLTMAFYSGRVAQHPAMENPTIVVITDRNDLDEQLHGTFSRCQDLLRQPPVRAESRAQLRSLLHTASGGVVFTTAQKFFPTESEDQHPLLSERRNIVVIADEAHRSQYDFIDGFARHMRDALPHASFIGFTGTPLERADRNTRSVFGEYISVYDIEQAVEDGATVPIYYEGRLARLDLNEVERPRLDPDFEEATEGEELEGKERLKTRWSQLEALVGAPKRIAQVAVDLVDHFERRLDAMDGKGMIVCMSRRVCVELYNAIAAIRPNWANPDDPQCALKIVMTGNATDPVDWQPHIHSKQAREALAQHFKDPADPFRLVIVRDMWLTGFDAPCLHTMYVDKPMRGHGLMQAIARVNRVFRDKPGGLVVDYIGLAQELKAAVATYTASGGKGDTAIDLEEAVGVMLREYEVCCDLFHGFDWSAWQGRDPQVLLGLLPAAQNHILSLEDGKERFTTAATRLSRAYALAVPHNKALAISDDVAFFQAVRAVLMKGTDRNHRGIDAADQAVRQIVSRAIASDEVIDIFAAAGLQKPDISVLSDEFLAEIEGMPQKHLAVDMLRKLLEGEIKVRGRRNVVLGRSFSELLEKALRRYRSRVIDTAEILLELVDMAKELREAQRRGEEVGLTEDEMAFYDALEVNDSAVAILGDEQLRAIAQELLRSVRNSVTIDWSIRESARAKIRVLIKRILRRHGYPPDKQEHATQLVLEQAEVICREEVAGVA